MKELAAVIVQLRSYVRRLLQLRHRLILGQDEVGIRTVNRFRNIVLVFHPVYKLVVRVFVKSRISSCMIDLILITAPHIFRFCFVVFSP